MSSEIKTVNKYSGGTVADFQRASRNTEDLPYSNTYDYYYYNDYYSSGNTMYYNLEEKVRNGLALPLHLSIEENLKGEITYCNVFKNLIDNNIKNVIFNEPATIILWKNGEKTVVKAQDGEPFDKEKGLAMAIMKYLNDDKANYNNLFKKWCNQNQGI